MNARVGLLLVILPGLLDAQAGVEYATGAGRAASTAAPAQKAGKAIAGAFDSLNRTLQNSEGSKPATPSATPGPHRAKKAAIVKTQPQTDVAEPKVDVSYEDPSGIQQGMEYDEIVGRFGPPSLKLTTGPGEEILYYTKKDLKVDTTMRNGKVTAVQKTRGVDQAAAKVP